MPNASFVQSDFRGGEWSQTAQGSIADPRYKTAMCVCLNGLPTEAGAWTRRPGFKFAQTTRGGAAGRLIAFDFEESRPYNLEFTNGYMRAFSGDRLIATNDALAVSSISTANPASVQLASAMPSSWATGNSFYFSGLGTSNPLLQNRVFVGTRVDSTHITVADAITGDGIDGATLGAFVSGTLNRVLEIQTPYVGTDWSALRCIQANLTGVLLNAAYPPYSLTVTALPNDTQNAEFSLAQTTFEDGPYYDPVPGGAQLAPAAQTGIINLTIVFSGYSSTTVYAKGAYVTYSAVNYRSLSDQNLNNQPDTSPTKWVAISAGEVVGPNGFTGSDIGRHIRLFSEPSLWVSGASYSAGNVVSYVNSNGATAYYTCLSNHTASATNAPGTSITTWGINAAGATWTWGTITALLNLISGSLSGSTNIGNMTQQGGLSAAFDGNTTKPLSGSAVMSDSAITTPGSYHFTRGYVGKNYSGASAQKIQSVTVTPATDAGLIEASTGYTLFQNVTLNLRGNSSSPSSASDGTLLGTWSSGTVRGGAYNPGPINIVSTDQATAWNYVWVEAVAQFQNNNPADQTLGGYISIAQIQFYSPAATSGAGVKVELIGGNLQYGVNIRTWRLGLFSNTTGWPKCGTYHEGRLWLSGAVANRIDGSVPVTVAPDGTIRSFSFAPTRNDGTVTDASAIAYTFDAKDVNPIFWMEVDQQGILCGTQSGEWLVSASANNNPLTPTSIQAHRVTKQGCANIEPRRGEHTLLFVQKHQRAVIEYFADVFSGKFTAPDLADKAKHITKASVVELAYQQELNPVLWSRLGNGAIAGTTYRRDTLTTSQGPTFAGWHRHLLGSGRIVESIVVGPSVGGNLESLAVVTNDPATNVRHVEILTDMFEEGSDLEDAWFLDDAVAPSSYTTATVLGGASGITINGLWHLNGKTVTVFAGGLDVGDWPVSNGSANVPFAPSTNQKNELFTAAFAAGFAGAMQIVAGFSYVSQGQLLRPDTLPESGARNGPGFGKERRVHKMAALLVDSQAISFGTDFDRLSALPLKTKGGTPIARNALMNGFVKDAINDDGEGFLSRICWQVSRPFPATVAAMGGFLSTQDE